MGDNYSFYYPGEARLIAVSLLSFSYIAAFLTLTSSNFCTYCTLRQHCFLLNLHALCVTWYLASENN